MDLRPRDRRVLRLVEVVMAGELIALAALLLFASGRVASTESAGDRAAFLVLALVPALVPVTGIVLTELALAGHSPQRWRWAAISAFMVTVPLCLAYLVIWGLVASAPWNI
jgi:hypothetical protein